MTRPKLWAQFVCCASAVGAGSKFRAQFADELMHQFDQRFPDYFTPKCEHEWYPVGFDSLRWKCIKCGLEKDGMPVPNNPSGAGKA